MHLFKKAKDPDEIQNNMQNNIAGKIIGFIIKVQTRFAIKMNIIISKFSTRQLKIIVIVFCVICGGLSTLNIADGFFRKDRNDRILKIDHVYRPKYFNKAGDENTQVRGLDTNVQNIQRLKKYLDSIKDTNPLLFDSLINKRNGLIDSLNLLDQIYNSQK